MATSTAEVVRAAGRPDHGAAGARLSELFARHGATVLGLCRLLLRHREEAEDAVQQTFLAAYRSLLSGTEPRHPAAWLATIARNECWARIQQRMREPLSEREPESTLPDPLAAAAARADLAELWRAIGELPRKQREALLLREFSGLSYVQLAEALAVSEPAVESLLFRARHELRLRLKLVYGSVGGVAPLAAIREALARAIGGLPDPSTTGGLAKLVSAPLVAKLAGAAAVVVAGGTVAVVESHSVRVATSSPSERAAKAAASAPARAAAPAPRALTSVESKPRTAARPPSVRVSSPPHRPPQVAPSTAATSLVRPAPLPALGDPGGSAPAPPSAPATTPDSTSSPETQSSPASGSPDESGSDGADSSSGSEPQSPDEGTGSTSGDTSGEDSGSSGSGDTAGSSDGGDGSSGGDSGSTDGQSSGDGGGGGGDSGDGGSGSD